MTNLDLAKRWIHSLMSGEYQQGIGGLRNDLNQFCCLGVYCDLKVKDGAGRWIFDRAEFKYFYELEDSGSHIDLIPELSSELLLDSIDQNELITLNDKGLPFDKIAERLSRLFGIYDWFVEEFPEYESNRSVA